MNKEIELKPCREAFEAWAGTHLPLVKTVSGVYLHHATDMAYKGWQAAQAQLQAENAMLREVLTEIMLNNKHNTTLARQALQHNEAL